MFVTRRAFNRLAAEVRRPALCRLLAEYERFGGTGLFVPAFDRPLILHDYGFGMTYLTEQEFAEQYLNPMKVKWATSNPPKPTTTRRHKRK